jgi:hypothetical protein
VSDQPLDRDRITKLVSTIFADDLHAKRVASLAGAAVGVLEGAALGIHAIGNALAMAEGLNSKHAVEQVDRLLSNGGISVWTLFENWAPYVVGDWPEIVTAHDWTDWPACGRHPTHCRQLYVAPCFVAFLASLPGRLVRMALVMR